MVRCGFMVVVELFEVFDEIMNPLRVKELNER